MGLIDNTPAGRLILHIMLSFAEFEREMIKERTVADKAIARQKKPDYPESRPRKITTEIIEQIHAGRSWKEPEISRATGTGIPIINHVTALTLLMPGRTSIFTFNIRPKQCLDNNVSPCSHESVTAPAPFFNVLQ